MIHVQILKFNNRTNKLINKTNLYYNNSKMIKKQILMIHA